MRVTRERIEGELTAMVISGEGTKGSEFKLLSEVSEKHDGVKTLSFPLRRPTYRGETSRGENRLLHTHGAGLKAFRVLKIYAGRGYTNFLFLVDREKFQTEEEEGEIERTLNEFGINVGSIQRLSEGSFVVKAIIGPREITIHVVIFGETEKLEEEEVKLIELKLGEIVQSEKPEIKRFYRERGISLEELVKNASRRDLAEAFPNLTRILETGLEDC